VTKEKIEELANKLKVKYYDISGKWNLNLEEIMPRIISECYQGNRQKMKKKNTQFTKVNNISKNKGYCLNKKEIIFCHVINILF